jgi:acyl-coenzyme A thioesterase 9
MASALRRLRVPATMRRGSPADVARFLPLLHELSAGARRGIPGWVPTAAPLDARLSPRKRSASWLEVTYPFSTDDELRHLYALGDGDSLRAGRFLEEIDAFSADCSFRHADGYHPERPLTVVTAAHDGLSIFKSLSARHDLRLRGAVVAVGTSSMEVQTDILRVHRGASSSEEEDYLGSCYTMMVARDRETFGPAAVHPLADEDVEAACVSENQAEDAARRKAARRRLAANALTLTPPSPSEVPILHALWRDGVRAGAQGSVPTTGGGGGGGGGGAAASGAAGGRCDGPVRVPMSQSEQRAVDIMQPAHRNMNGYMFGGYLMRRALEVGWLSAFRFGKRPASFAGVDDVVFNKPVEVGTFLEYSGRVVYVANDSSLRVHVQAHRLDLRTDAREIMNDFHFIFRYDDDNDGIWDEHNAKSGSEGSHPELQVQPDTYEEGMLYLEGRRRWMAANDWTQLE